MEQTSFPPPVGTFEIKIPIMHWTQVDGDANPGAHGGTIAESDGERIYLLEIQPKIEYIGEGEALDTGEPFWSREACYDLADLQGFAGQADGWSPRGYVGMDDQQMADMTPEQRAIALACAALAYGEGVDEGPSGWARDVIGNRRVRWYRGKRPQGWRYLADEDQEFRRLLRERAKDGES